MGSSTKTYRNFDTGEVFTPTTDLASMEILKYAGIGKLEGIDLGSGLIKSISSFTNSAYFNAMSVGGVSVGSTQLLDEQAILKHFGVNGYLGFASFRQPSGDANPGPILKIIDALNTQGTVTSTIQQTANIQVGYSSGSQYNLSIGTRIGGTGSLSIAKNIFKHQVYSPTLTVTSEGIGTITQGYKPATVVMFTYQGNPCPSFVADDYGSLTCYIKYMKDEFETTTVTTGTPPVTTTTYSIKQVPTLVPITIAKPEVQILLVDYVDGGGEHVNYAWEHEIKKTTTYRHFLVMTFKKDGEFIEDTNLTGVFNNFGIKKSEIYEAEGLADTKLKHAMFCYAAKEEIDTKYGAIKDDFIDCYKFEQTTGKLIINSPSVSITYSFLPTANFFGGGESYEEPEPILTMTFNGVTFDVEPDSYVRLIPIDELVRMPLNLKYKFIVEHFRIGGFSEVIVKVAWYQTGFFGFIAFIVGAVVSYLIGGPAGLAKFVAFYIAMKIVASLGIAELTLAVSIIGIAYGVYDSGGWETLDLMKQTATVVGVAGNFAQYYFTIETDKITKQIQGIEEETDANQDKINEMTKEGLYQPMENTQNFYDTCFDFHNIYLENAFNYDFMYNFDSVVPKGI